METTITITMVIEAWLAVGCTLLIYSFLYKDNPLFKLGEYMYVGITAAWGLCSTWYMNIWPDLIKPLSRVIGSYFGQTPKPKLGPNEDLLLLIPLILGLLMLTRFSSKIGWLSRYTFAFIMGAVSGMAIPLVISANIFKQMVPTLQKLWGPGITAYQTIDTLLILIGVVTVLIYFFFSLEHTGAVKYIARTGIFYMMIAFGAAFGYTVMARESLAIGRLTKLVNWSSKEYYFAPIVLLVILTIIIVLWELLRKKEGPEKSA